MKQPFYYRCSGVHFTITDRVNDIDTEVTMATAIMQTAEDQITCTICLDIFEEPKALPCLHTFCKKCINNYITKKKSQLQRKKGFLCPICRRHVSVPAHMKHNPEVWADHLENNHVVSSMIDAYQTTRGKARETCRHHPEKELDFFCFDHKQFICSMCFPQHRRCTEVVTRDDSTNDIKKSGNSNSNESMKQNCMKEQIDLLFEQCNVIENVIDDRRTAFEFQLSTDQEVRDKIVSMKQRINGMMHKLTEGTNGSPREIIQAADQLNSNQSEAFQVQKIKLPFQGKATWTTGITSLPSGKLLFVDHTNGAVLVFSLTFDLLCKTNIIPEPYDVVTISSTQDRVLLSIPETRELTLCDVLQNGFVEIGKKIKTNISCKAVASDGRYVAVCSNSELQIFETDYEVWMIVLDESYARTKFTYITIISSQKKVFITDQTFSDPHIICLAFDGATLWKVADRQINLCTGICVTGTQLMVTSWDSGKLYTLSLNGDDLKTYNGAVAFPWKLHVSTRQKMICVSQHKSTLSEECKRTIKVLRLI